MQHPQIVVHERDGRLAEETVRSLAAVDGGRHADTAASGTALANAAERRADRPGPKVTRPPDRDLALIEERVSWQLPTWQPVAVGDLDAPPSSPGCRWDVGAAYAIFPPLTRDLLPAVVAGLMRRAVRDGALPVILPRSRAP